MNMSKVQLPNMPGHCKHEIDPKIPLVFDKRYGRIGVCKLCRRPVVYIRLNTNPKRERPKATKKQRRIIRANTQEALRDEIRRNK